MKKILLVVLAAISALICTELIVSKVIGYPTYGVEMKMTGIRGLNQVVNIFKPCSRYWTVEGGNKVYRRNNLGLPGIDIKNSKDSKYLFVLGSSFVEGYQLPPQKIAASIFQNRLQAKNSNYQVLNLGISGHDPYDLYWRSSYFENKYTPTNVILVIDSTFDDWFKRHQHPLSFDPNLKAPKRLNSAKMKYAGFIVNRSSLINLLTNLTKKRDPFDNEEKQQDSSKVKIKGKLDPDLIACISNFNTKYKGRFSLISIIDENNSNSQMRDFCNVNKIRFFSRNILLPKYRLNGKGHLNAAGNELLGELLYESFIY